MVLIHGTFSEPAVFETFNPLVPNVLNSMFVISTLDYSQDVDSQVTSTVPDYSTERLSNHVRRNVIGVAYNAPLLLNDLTTEINIFKTGIFPAVDFPVAAVQADIVAHSLGGLMARGMSHVGTEFPGLPSIIH